MRGTQKLSVAELCRRAGVRRQTYTELRRTTRRPQRYIVLSIAGVLNMDMDLALSLAKLSPSDVDTVRVAIVEAHDLSNVQKHSLLALLTMYEAEAEAEAGRDTAGRSGVPVPLFQAPARLTA
jgi:transcriptional regulator with XRE-family HTH domain